MNFEDELTKMLSDELAKTIDAEILKNLMAMAKDKRLLRKDKIESLYPLYNSRNAS